MIFTVPGAAIAAGLLLLGGRHTPTQLPEFQYPVRWMFFSLALMTPAIETLILIAPTVVAARFLSSHWGVCVVGSIPISLLHVIGNDWVRALIVLWSFVWSAHCYLRLRASNEAFGRRYLYLFGMHAVNNALVVAMLPMV